MARSSRTARLVIALSVAAVLAVFLIYVSIAGGRTPQLSPSQLAGHPGKVSLVGKVVGPVHGEGYSTRGLPLDLAATSGAAFAAVQPDRPPDAVHDAIGRVGRAVRVLEYHRD